MTCYAYVMTWVGLLLMQLLGWVSTMSLIITWVFKKNFVVGIFGVWIFGLLQSYPLNRNTNYKKFSQELPCDDEYHV